MTNTLRLSKKGMEKVASKIIDIDAKNKGKKEKKESNRCVEKSKDRPLTIKEKIARKEKTIRWLCKNYPKCFFANDPVPLKIGIFFDIRESLPKSISRRALNIALNKYTRRKSYIKALITNRNRYNLEGEIVGEVTESEKAQAIEFSQKFKSDSE